jgi:DNA-directed RNA polymerase subunit M/transcription elongation factor TFIIS
MNDKFCDRCSTIILTQYGGNLEERRCAECQADIDAARRDLARQLLRDFIDCEQKSAYVTLDWLTIRLREIAEEGA